MFNFTKASWKLSVTNLLVLSFLYFILSTLRVQIGPDLNVYLRAALTALKGNNPYDVATINRVTEGVAILDSMPFLYSPISLSIFIPLTWISQNVAMHLFDAFMALAFGLTSSLLLSKIRDISLRDLMVFDCLALFGFGFPIFYTIIFQNPAPLESASIILGTFFFLGEKPKPILASFAFVLSVALKVQPIVFLAFLLLAFERSKLKIVICLLIPIALGIALPAIVEPELTLKWFAGIASGPWRHDPSDFSFTRLTTKFGLSENFGFMIQIAWLVAILAPSAWLAHNKIKGKLSLDTQQRFEISMFLILTYLLISPRLKPYMLLLAIPTILMIRHKFIPFVSILPTLALFIVGVLSPDLIHYSVLFTLLIFWLNQLCPLLNPEKAAHRRSGRDAES